MKVQPLKRATLFPAANCILKLTALAVNAAVILSVPQAQAEVITIGPQGDDGVYYGNARGYWFTAPVDFRITGIHVLAPEYDGPYNFMNWAVIRFNDGPPPEFAGATSAFTHLGLGFDQPANTFAPVSLNVFAGDMIGIYGTTAKSAGGTGWTSYANYATTISIFGNLVTLTRSGMQSSLDPLNSPSGMHDVWQEIGQISRVEFSYTAIPEPGAAYFAGLAVFGWVVCRFRNQG